MSTTALICMLKNNSKYDGIPVHFDGYIEGVGKCLKENWEPHKKVQDLFDNFNDQEIRVLGEDFATIEFYPLPKNKEALRYLNQMWKRLKNMTLDKLKNEGGNFDFIYIWDGVDWYWFDIENNELKPIRGILKDEME